VVVSAGVAPIALIGGWTLAASRQPVGYDSLRDTISALAARGATDPAIMTIGLAVVGLCYLVTAAGLEEAGRSARAVLALGGAATVLVAASPQPNSAHVPAATVGFLALALWPACTVGPTRRAGIVGTAILLILLGWLVIELRAGNLLGLSERVLTGAQALCPLGFVWVLVRRRQRSAHRSIS
jgi:hypothetical membrane protein